MRKMSKEALAKRSKPLCVSLIHERSIPVPESGCWIWERALFNNGYGHLVVNGKATGAHRASWMAHFGEVPFGLHVCHKCDVRSCVNPDHLFLGTAKDNSDDMDRKSRRAICRGSAHGRAKLTEEKVKDIRDRFCRGDSRKEIARELGVSYQAVYDASVKRRWGHV